MRAERESVSCEWLTAQQTANILNCSVERVRAMLREGGLPGKKVKGRWRIEAADVERIASMKPSSATLGPPVPQNLPGVDPGMVEVSMALAGIATAIAALLPAITGIADGMRIAVALLAGILATLSAYSALWMLARHCFQGSSATGIEEIWKLITDPSRAGPHWFIAIGLLVWSLLSGLISALAAMR